MALAPVKVSEIKANIIAQLESAFNQTIPLLPKSFNRVLAGVLAAVYVSLYKYASWMFLQMFPATADNESVDILGQEINPLQAWGNLLASEDPLPATRAEFTIQINVTTQSGSLASQTQLTNDDNGVTYHTLGSVLLDAATKTVNVRAVEDQGGGGGLGEIGNLEVGATLSFVQPLANVERDTSIITVVTTASDAETADDYRDRIARLFQARPQGGAYSDYRAWGEEVEGILRCYPYTGDPGEVTVYVSSDTEADRVPTSAQLVAVADSIELDADGLATRRPAGSLVSVYGVTIVEFDVQVVGLSLTTIDEATVQSNIRTAVTNYFLNREMFISGLDVPPRRDRVQQSEVSGTVADIVSGSGGVFESVIVTESASPIIVRSLGEGELAAVDAITFT
jgi:uncharacterized phage protein gp47/JayE